MRESGGPSSLNHSLKKKKSSVSLLAALVMVLLFTLGATGMSQVNATGVFGSLCYLGDPSRIWPLSPAPVNIFVYNQPRHIIHHRLFLRSGGQPSPKIHQ